MVAGAGGLLCPGSPVVLGDIGRLVEDVVTTTTERGSHGCLVLKATDRSATLKKLLLAGNEHVTIVGCATIFLEMQPPALISTSTIVHG